MQEVLVTKLHAYIRQNNPDLLLNLQQEGNVTSYLQEKVCSLSELISRLEAEGNSPLVIEEICLEELTQDLRPSRYNYLCVLLEEEFEADYWRLQKEGTLLYEVLNLMEFSAAAFDTCGFTEENESNPQLRNALIGDIGAYFTQDE